MTPDSPQKLEIDWLKTAGGAFAAVSSAFLLSTLGAAGTIIGAALGSVIVTVGGALYTQGLARSHQRLARVQSLAVRKVGVTQAEVRRAARNSGEGDAVETNSLRLNSASMTRRTTFAPWPTSHPARVGESASWCCRGSGSR